MGKWAIHISVHFQGINQQDSSDLLSRALSVQAATIKTLFHVEQRMEQHFGSTWNISTKFTGLHTYSTLRPPIGSGTLGAAVQELQWDAL